MTNNKITEKRKRPAPIQWKIFAYLLGFCFLLLTILWLFQTVFLDSFYKSIKANHVKQSANEIVEQINSNDLEKLVASISKKNDLYVEIWLPDNRVILSAGDYPEENKITDYARLQIFNSAISNNGTATQYKVVGNLNYNRKQENIQHARVIESNGQRALLLISTYLLPVDSTYETIRYQLIVVSIIMVVLSIGLAWLLSRRVAKPIKQLNDSAKKLGEGDYLANFNATGYEEIVDLSETLTHAAKELSKTDLLRKELVANASHDLRTPLTLITGYAEMMQEYPEETTSDNLQIIVDESKRLTSLVNDLLDLSRLQSGAYVMAPDYFNLTELISDIILRYSKFREQDNYKIEFQNEGYAIVFADITGISQVVYNLIGNAINYTGDDKRVTVTERIVDSRVIVEVIDTGEGMTQNTLDNVWSRYYRETSEKKRNITGSGLGLSIVQSVLDRHPDTLYGAESTPNTGSKFWFSMPLSPLNNEQPIN